MKLHHLGIACADIKETLELIKAIFPVTGCSEILFDPEQDANVCMITLRESQPLELISGPVVQSFVRKGILLYHTCWEVIDMDAALSKFATIAGCRMIVEPKKAVLFDFRRVAFLSTPAGLIELLEVSGRNYN